MRVIEVNMGRHWNEGAGVAGDPREGPPTNGPPRFALVGGERANLSATVAPSNAYGRIQPCKVTTLNIPTFAVRLVVLFRQNVQVENFHYSLDGLAGTVSRQAHSTKMQRAQYLYGDAENFADGESDSTQYVYMAEPMVPDSLRNVVYAPEYRRLLTSRSGDPVRVRRGEHGASRECKGGVVGGDHRENPPASDIIRHDSHIDGYSTDATCRRPSVLAPRYYKATRSRRRPTRLCLPVVSRPEPRRDNSIHDLTQLTRMCASANVFLDKPCNIATSMEATAGLLCAEPGN
ncbi:hypothetical protein PR048_021106 [Dryococelus australis]|uniref:Uncharacterized protein n=1 Tax=Dryococelus australis TaxID=614101 RepID=A0ABQ9GXD2_9NEOP|nr:hypothetical protein PR048_021106 [Dryococelus australis]